jgi:ElaB/YqjD/DUF883 family membrane-anchored ribosome-binding protein
MVGKSQDGSGNGASGAFDNLEDDAHKFSTDASHLASAIGEDLKRVGDRTRQQAQHALDVASEQVRANPTTTLALAASFGLVIGLLLAKR